MCAKSWSNCGHSFCCRSSYFRALVITTATTEIINHAPTESVFQEPIQISNPLQSSTPDALQVNSAALLDLAKNPYSVAVEIESPLSKEKSIAVNSIIQPLKDEITKLEYVVKKFSQI